MLDWKAVQDSEEWHDWIALAFSAFDADGSGTIGVEDLAALLCGGTCVVRFLRASCALLLGMIQAHAS